MSLLGRAAAPATLALRRLRADAPLAASLFLVVAATVFLLAAAPRAFDRMGDDGLRFALDRASPFERDFEITRAARIRPGPAENPVGNVAAEGLAYERRLPAAVREAIDARTTSVETVRNLVVPAPGEPASAGTVRYLTLRTFGDAVDRIRFGAGRAPAPVVRTVDLPFRDQGASPLFEVALSSVAAGQLGVAVGDRLYAVPAPDDPLVRDVPLAERAYVTVDVTGLFEARRGQEAWFAASRLGRAVTRDEETATYIYGYALFPPGVYRELLAAVEPLALRYAWRYSLDPAGFADADFDRLTSEVRGVESEFGASSYGQTLGLGAQTGLTRILARFRADRDASEALLAVGASGLLAAAVAVLALLAALGVERRAETTALVRSRGASIAQLLGSQAVQGLAIALPAGLAGFAPAALLVPGRGGALSAWLAAAVVLAVPGLLAASALAPARRGLVAPEREETAVTRVSPRRAAAEALVVVASLVGAFLLRRRGLGDGEGAEGFDPYLAAVPLLLALAVALAVARLLPFPLRLLAAAAARRPDLVPALALRRASRQPSVTAAPILVLVLAVSAGVFAAVMAGTVADAQAASSGEEPLSPLAAGTLHAFRVESAVAGLYAALAVGLAPTLTARARLRDVAYLRALGLSRREVVQLAGAEFALPVAAALALGLLLGFLLPYAVEPGLDLTVLAPDRAAVPLTLDLLVPALLATGLLLVAAAVVYVTGAAAMRTSIARVLRTGER